MATQPRSSFKSIVGRRLGLGAYGELVARGGAVQLTRPAVGATITVSDEAATTADTRDLSITLTDAAGNALDYAEDFEIRVYSSSAMTTPTTTGGSTGITAVTGTLLAVVAKKKFQCTTTTAGVWTGSYLDTGTDAAYLGVVLPNGRKVAGGLLTCA